MSAAPDNTRAAIVLAIGIAVIAVIYWLWNWERLEVFKLLLDSFFPLALLIIAVLGSIALLRRLMREFFSSQR